MYEEIRALRIRKSPDAMCGSFGRLSKTASWLPHKPSYNDVPYPVVDINCSSA